MTRKSKDRGRHNARTIEYDYTPHAKQALAHSIWVDELLFGGSAGGGKDLAVDTPVLTTEGWKRHGVLAPGDFVYGKHGRPIAVLANYTPQTPHHYLFTFSTGETIRCGAGHLWAVQSEQDRARLSRQSPEWKAARRTLRPSRAKLTPSKGAFQQQAVAALNKVRADDARADEVRPDPWGYVRVVDADEVAELVHSERKALTIPRPERIEGGKPWPSVLPPWVMGMWLGDGHTKGDTITQGDEDAATLMERMAENGYVTLPVTKPMHYQFQRADTGDKLGVALAAVFGPSLQRMKRIPDWVFTTTYADRLAVVQGLIDADGHVNKRGQVELSLSNANLFTDAVRLIATLGVRVSQQRDKAAGYRDKAGQHVACKPRHRMKVSTEVPLATYPRKLARINTDWADPNDVGRRSTIKLVSVEKIPADVPTNCITVDEPSGIYLAGETLIPTHNSRMARAEALKICMQVPGARVLFLRKTFPDLNRSVVEPMLQEIPSSLGKYNRTEHVWKFHNGSILELGHLQTAADLLKYQGAEYVAVFFEELTQFTEEQYTYLMSRLRAGGAIKEAMERLGMRTRMISTANPGGPGHHFVKKRFVDPAPHGTVFKMAPDPENPNPGTRVFIPSRVSDNPSIDSDYINKLNAMPENLRKALRDGDWNVLDGVRFSAWSESMHVVEPDISPMDLVSYPRCVAVDWGFSDPFAAVWLAKLPDGTLLVYRELYATEKTNIQQAQMILAAEMDGERHRERPIPVVMDPSMWRRSQGSDKRHAGSADLPPVGSPAHDYMKTLGQVPLKAYNQRVPGWSQLDNLLAISDTGFPKLQVFDTCRDLIRTLPALPRDKRNPEDVDTHMEDHLADALRYGAMFMAGRMHVDKKAADAMRTVLTPTETGHLSRAGF